MLQLGLVRAGHSPGNKDGIFGLKTENALRRFQAANRLVPDGIAGEKTFAALKPYLCGYREVYVRRGDTLFSLAQQYGTTPEALRTANPSVSEQHLQIGSVLTVPLPFDVVPTDIPYSSRLVDYIMEGLAARYPFIRLRSIGESVAGMPILLAVIGAGETQVSFNAAHHANEWITTPVLLKFLEQYADACAVGGSIYGTDAGMLFARTTLYLVPLVNPDGVDLVTGAFPVRSPLYDVALRLAADYREIPFPDGWKANIAGTDLNLNYPAGWEQAREIKFAQGFTRPAPRDYVGYAPLSAPESLAMSELTHRQNFALVLAYHSQGRVIFWQYADYEVPRALEIGEALAAASDYALSDTPYNAAFAGYKDYFIAQYLRPGYTVEVGIGTNPLPLVQFDAIYRENLGLLVTALALA